MYLIEPVLSFNDTGTGETQCGDLHIRSIWGLESFFIYVKIKTFIMDEIFSYVFALGFQVRLKAKPAREGVLRILGVKWVLAGVAAGSRDFVVTGPQNVKSKSGGREDLPASQQLKFHVLGVCFRFPYNLYLRSISRLTWQTKYFSCNVILLLL